MQPRRLKLPICLTATIVYSMI